MLPPWAARVIVAIIVLLAGSNARSAQPGEELTISVLTMGPGDHAFTKFGHIAILVEDAEKDSDLVYNYGTFSFESPTLVADFLKGRLSYWLSVETLDRMVKGYARARRTVSQQELELTPAQRVQIRDFLIWNARPENRAYLYDYYRDNCSTRVRDVLDRALGGALWRASREPASFTYRDHTRRLTAEDLPLYLGLDLLTGPLVDAPIRRWDEAFLPDELQAILRDVTVTTASGPKPLVRSERVLTKADRPPVRLAPPEWGVYFAVLGALAGGGMVALGFGAASRQRARVALGLTLCVLGTAAGLLGLVFLFFWLGTNHEFGHRNADLLLCPPYLLALAVLGVQVARGKLRAARAALYLLALTVVLGVAGVSGLWPQRNYEIAALLLPIWLGLASALALSVRTRTTP